MELINKTALVAEIERLRKVYKQCPTRSNYEDGLKESRLIGYKDALDKINKLDVVDEDAIKCDWYNKGYIKGRKEANIPARELGLPSEMNVFD